MGLTIYNSWHFEGGLWQDPELVRVKKSNLNYHPRPFDVDELVEDTVWTLRGPRRAGKTVSLKLLISELIENKCCDPKKIIWTSVENLRTPQQLDVHLRMLIEKFKPRYLFCDEITSIIGWQNIIKKIRDEGLLRKCCTVLTGSSSFDLKKGSERLAGRKGVFVATDRVLLPMDFLTFQRQYENLTISDFLVCGGFPYRVDELVKNKIEGTKFDPLFGMSVLDDVFFYEFVRRKLDRNIALEILFRLSQIQPHAISYTSFAKQVNVKPDTVQKYLNVLGDCFLLGTIFSYDTAKSRVALKKDRKFIWIDPALAYLPFALGQGELPKLESIAEQVIGVSLIRNFELRLFEGVSAPRQVFTWKSKAGTEIDYLIINRSHKIQFPIEVKYQNNISPVDHAQMEKTFKVGKIVSKNTSKQMRAIEIVPLEIFLNLKMNEFVGGSQQD